MRQRARAIASAGGLETAIANGSIPPTIEITLSEALVLGLLRHCVSK